jgi:hypothetical protein
LRVGLDVIGTSYWHALKARKHRQTMTLKIGRLQIKFEEVTESWVSPEVDLRRNQSARQL